MSYNHQEAAADLIQISNRGHFSLQEDSSGFVFMRM